MRGKGSAAWHAEHVLTPLANDHYHRIEMGNVWGNAASEWVIPPYKQRELELQEEVARERRRREEVEDELKSVK